jgi:aspartyl-tRNA(Asn)/glutamyl-tRNA(Gln) amidotransferase subunit B
MITAAAGKESAKRAAHAVVGEVSRLLNEGELDLDRPKFTPDQVAEVWKLQDAGTISSTAAREVMAEVLKTGKRPSDVVQEKGLSQVSDMSALERVVDDVLSRSPGEVEKYRSGKKNLLGFFVGQAMKELKGKGNPGVLNGLFKKKLGD